MALRSIIVKADPAPAGFDADSVPFMESRTGFMHMNLSQARKNITTPHLVRRITPIPARIIGIPKTKKNVIENVLRFLVVYGMEASATPNMHVTIPMNIPQRYGLSPIGLALDAIQMGTPQKTTAMVAASSHINELIGASIRQFDNSTILKTEPQAAHRHRT